MEPALGLSSTTQGAPPALLFPVCGLESSQMGGRVAKTVILCNSATVRLLHVPDDTWWQALSPPECQRQRRARTLYPDQFVFCMLSLLIVTPARKRSWMEYIYCTKCLGMIVTNIVSGVCFYPL